MCIIIIIIVYNGIDPSVVVRQKIINIGIIKKKKNDV